jgi:hypothetical protein
MNIRALFSFVVFGLFLIGCGSGSSKQVAPAVSLLAGNWLIVGPMPTYGFTPPGTGVFSLAMTFDVTGNNITAASYGSGFCASSASPPIFNNTFSFEGLSTGVIAADGSFSLQTPQNTPIYSLSVQGKTPGINAEQFAGTYAASFNSTIGPACVGNSGGMFTATSFPLVNGVYTATGNFQTLSATGAASTTTPITMQVNLQQGAPVLDPATGISKASNIAMGGSIRMQGFPCFTSGTANTTLFVPTAEPLSTIQGNVLSVSFTMDDGSTLNLTGALTDATESQISALFSLNFTGECAGVTYFFPSMKLIKQS